MPQESKRNIVPILIAVFVLLLVVAYAIGGAGGRIENKTSEITQDKVTVTRPDAMQGKLPAGFPTDIPVEIAAVADAYTANYTERGIVQYTLRYTTDKSPSAMFSKYSDYLKKNSFEIVDLKTELPQEYIYGIKENKTLLATISVQNSRTLVQLTYSEKK